MKNLLFNPLLAVVVSVLGGATAGLLPLWQAAETFVAQAAVKPVDQKAAEQRAQGWDFWTVEIDGLASELKEEKARLRKQAEQVEQRAARFAAEQQELEKTRAELEALRKEIGDKVIEIKADEQKNLRALAQTYTNLSPKAAVSILRELDDTTVVKILSLMKPDVVGPIFEEMTTTKGTDGTLAKRAAALSEKLRLMKAAKPTAT